MAAIPDPPWTLGGEAVVALAWRARLPGRLPSGLRRLPGPVVLMAERWLTSPVGPYLALAVGEPARVGRHVGLCFSTVVVSTTDSRAAGQALWGIPRQCGTLRWSSDASGAEVIWEERGIVLRSRWNRRAWGVGLRSRALQVRGDEPIVVRMRMRGRARRGRVHVEVPASDALAPLAGGHMGAHLGGAELVFGRAVVPAGLWATLRAPARGVEPGLP